ncbi:GNAT family N-acetyltransferase [Tissierella creatinophila]|uniref:Spermidine N(1)-acetyltransferase n=1 Tax=Tissierella creatinophila DSM 6911 TaxID=1123403 RepID=A0A1U7M7Y4_TISCR|nr:GNAT family N-acetyltransferase [Tissierella creatinophila]OLS03433.1 spermidine N(1)-acetyltransferase [Tissierella creatinophila DSM 6911]
MEIIGDRITIRPLKVQDVFDMRNWGEHENPLLWDYNFPSMSDSQIRRWYDIKTKSFFNKYFGISLKDGRLIGYMGIKEIKFLKKESTLGIVFDPNFLNMGYGTETLKYFLESYFTQMNMKRMYLEVAEFNARAQSVYKKMGFENIGYYLEEFFDDDLDLDNSYYKDAKYCFVINGKKIYNYIYKMKLDRETFFSKISSIK